MSNLVGELVVELTFEDAQFQRGITAAKREIASYGKATQTSIQATKDQKWAMAQGTVALNNMKTEYKAMNSLLTDYTNKQKEYNRNSPEWSKYQRNINNLKHEMYALSSHYDKFQRQLYTENSGWTKFGNVLDRSGDKMIQVGTWMSDLGHNITRIGALASAGGALFIKQAVDFESGLVQIKKTTGATAEEMKLFEGQIKQMASEMPIAVGELQNLAAIAGQLGVKTDNLAHFTETMAKIGTATSLSSSEASEAIARFTNVSGTGQRTITNIGSALVELGNNLATSETEILNMAGLLVGTLATLGATEDQVLGLSGAMSSLGITAERGGSSISKFFIDMASAVSDGGEDLAKFANYSNMTSEAFSNLFKQDSVGAFQSFIDGLAKIKAEGGDIVKVLDDMEINEVRMRDTILKLVNGHELLAKSLGMSKMAYSEATALEKEYNEQLKSTASQWEIAKNKAGLVAIEIGQALLPAVMELLNSSDGIVKMAQDFADWFTGLDDGIKNNIVQWGALSIAIGPVISTIGTLLNVGGGILKLFGGIFKGIGIADGAFKAFKAGGIAEAITAISTGTKSVSGFGVALSLLTNPATWVVASVVALGVAFNAITEDSRKAYEAVKDFPDIRGITAEQAESLRRTKDEVIGIKTELDILGQGGDFTNLTTNLTAIGDEIKNLNDEKIKTLQDNFAKLPKTIQDALSETVSNAIKGIEEQTAEVEKTLERIDEIANKKYDKNGVLQESYITEQALLAHKMLDYYAQTLSENEQQYNDFMNHMSRDRSELTTNELTTRSSYLQKALESERNLHQEQFNAIEAMRQADKGNSRKYWEQQERVAQASSSKQNEIIKEFLQTGLDYYTRLEAEQGRVLDKSSEQYEQYVRSLANQIGVSYEEAVKLLNEADFTRPFEKMSQEAKLAFADLTTAMNKFAESKGIDPKNLGTEHVQDFIEFAKQAGLTWEELELLSKDANIDDNTKAFIQAVLDSGLKWQTLTFEEKIAKIKTEGEKGLTEFIQSVGAWNEIPVDKKEAILKSIQNGEKLSDVLVNMEYWNLLTLSEKLALVATEGHESMEALLTEYRVFENLPEGVTKEMIMDAIVNGKVDVEQFISTFKGAEFETKVAEIQATADPSNAVGTFLLLWLDSILPIGDKNVNIEATDDASSVIDGAQSKADTLGETKPNVGLSATDNATRVIAGAQGAANRLGSTHPNSNLRATDLATWIIASVRNSLANLNGREAHTYVYTHHRTTGKPRYATGTNYHHGGLAILGDGGKHEPFLTPQGFFGISPNRDTVYDLPLGTKVWSSIQKFKSEAQRDMRLSRLMDYLPKFAQGTSQSFLDAFNRISLPFDPSKMNVPTQNVSGDSYYFNITVNPVGSHLTRQQADSIIEPLLDSAKRLAKKRGINLREG